MSEDAQSYQGFATGVKKMFREWGVDIFDGVWQDNGDAMGVAKALRCS